MKINDSDIGFMTPEIAISLWLLKELIIFEPYFQNLLSSIC